MQGCATLTNDSNENPGDISKTLPPTAAGIGVEPKVFKSEQEATKDLTGYNYGLANQSDGSVKAYVSGLAGSGADTPTTQSHPAFSPNVTRSLEPLPSDPAKPVNATGHRRIQCRDDPGRNQRRYVGLRLAGQTGLLGRRLSRSKRIGG
jgi:hypothetical protein